MQKDFQHETWRQVKFDFEFTNQLNLEVSNCGRVRSTTKITKQRILKGSEINGYKFIQLKLYKPREEKVEKKLQFLKEQILKVSKKLTPLKSNLKNRKTRDESYRAQKKIIHDLEVLHEGIKKKYRVAFWEEEKRRIVNQSLLIHRLVAENFCVRKTESQLLVIHLDHHKHNNHFSNLKWVTQDEATAHWQTNPRLIKHFKNAKGKRSAAQKFKLNETRVMLIKKKINEGKALRLLSKQFQVSEAQLWRIKKEINWKDIKAAV